MSGNMTARPAPGPVQSSYVKRRIDVLLTLGDRGGAEPGPGQAGETITVSGLRVSAGITKAGGISQGALSLRIYGLTESVMNRFSVVSGPNSLKLDNSVTVMAGDDVHGMSMVYQGTIHTAWADYASQPDVAFCITSLAAMAAAIRPVLPSSYRGGVDVADIMAKLARDMNFQFENNGVSGIILADAYFPGTAYEQAERCAEHAGIHMTVDDGTLAIWPEGGARTGSVPLISPQTGMRGYPVRTLIGVDVETLFNPAIKAFSKVRIESRIKPCCGEWQVNFLEHSLESEVPNGAWFSRLSCVSLGYVGH